MVQIEGKYELVHQEQVLEHLVAIGVPEDKAKTMASMNKTVEIKLDGKKITLVFNAGAPSTLTLDEEIEEPEHFGHILKSLAKLDDDTLTVTSKDLKNGNNSIRLFKFSNDGVILTSSNSDPKVPTAKCTFSRA